MQPVSFKIKCGASLASFVLFLSPANSCVLSSCNGAVNFLLDWDKDAQYRLAALQSKAGSALLQQAGRKPGDLSSVVLVEPGQAYVKSDAVLRIGRRLNTPFFVLGSLGLPVPHLIRDAAYDLVCQIARHIASTLCRDAANSATPVSARALHMCGLVSTTA